MVAAQSDQDPPLHMTEAEYLAFEEASEERHEWRAGRIHAMTGGTLHHSQIAGNFITHLNNLLVNTDCIVTNSDMRLHIASANAFRYPDLAVICGGPAYYQGRTDTVTNPLVLVEVLSPGTALVDRNEKLAEYTQIETLGAYLLVAQDQAKVEQYARHESGQWLYRYVTGLDAEIPLPALDCKLSLAQIYSKVIWDDEPPTAET